MAEHNPNQQDVNNDAWVADGKPETSWSERERSTTEPPSVTDDRESDELGDELTGEDASINDDSDDEPYGTGRSER